ncbi:MAG: T9SS type A sorting domain-containing protein [Bacteroidota bacterium]
MHYLDAATPVIIYAATAKTIDTTVIDSATHIEVWDIAAMHGNDPIPRDTIIRTIDRPAVISAITASYSPTTVIVRDITLSDIDYSTFMDDYVKHADTAFHGLATRNRRDSVFQFRIQQGTVRDARQHDADSTYDAHRQVAATNLEFLYRTIPVLKSDLPPVVIGSAADYNFYRTPVYQINLSRERGGMSGPTDIYNGSGRFDLRLRWTGKEKLALRSIAVRDTLGEMLMGTGPASAAYRQGLADIAQQFYFGTSNPGPTTQPLAHRARVYFGDEPLFPEFAGFNAIDRLLRDSTAPGGDTTRSLRPHFEVNQLTLHKALISAATTIEPGFYPTSAGKGVPQAKFAVAFDQPPVLRMHDGGIWNVPELKPTADSVELFETAFQRASICEYNPGQSSWPFQWNKLTDLGIAAQAASHTGRWLIPWVGVHGQYNFKWFKSGDNFYVKPESQWIMEAAQVRLQCNLALCYGSRGVHYAWVGSDSGEPALQPPTTDLDSLAPADKIPVVNPNHRFMSGSNWGPVGSTVDQTADRVTSFPVNMGDTTVVLPGFYTGWGVRLREMTWLDKTWFPSVGKAMLKLRWRDAYSIHFTEPQSYMATTPGQTSNRPLPSTEIVTAVQSWKPSINGAPIQIDPPAKTYVELGFFNTVKGADTTKRMLDENYIFVVNRRVFERPDDTSATSAYGKKLDSLAETRTISLRLNIPHPDPSSYNFVRVTEVQPDTVALPLIGARQGLDTILFGDSAVAITLRPGGAALLKITYAPAGTAFMGGDIRYNNQRKIVFDGLRYHACYFKPIKYCYPFEDPLKKSHIGFEDAIYYRRSFPMTSTTGGILWEPIEYLVSDTTADSCVRQNRFPSMSVRVKGDRDSAVAGGDTVITIVWTRYKGPNTRSVVLRNMRSKGDGAVLRSNRQEVMGVYTGYNDGSAGEPAWGTPVVSRLDGGDIVAWSDSALGIGARLRVLGSGSTWWQSSAPNVGYSSVIYPSSTTYAPSWSPSPPGVCMFPSLPASAHARGLDSNIGIVWQDMQSGTGTSRIDYARLVHRLTGTQNWISTINTQVISQGDVPVNLHPSIDATQDVWYDVQEGVTWDGHMRWETRTMGTIHPSLPPTRDISLVCFSSLYTPTIRRVDPANTANTSYWNPFWDDIKPTQQWTYDWQILRKASESGSTRYFTDFFPNTSSLNARAAHHPDEKIRFSLVATAVSATSENDYFSFPMAQSIREYAIRSMPDFHSYLYGTGGFYPNGAASQTRQPLRESVIYRIYTASNLLQTSRQFFARVRPSGYTAQGRQVSIPVNDSIPVGFSLGMYDAWAADNSSSSPLVMAAYPDSITRIDSLPQVHALLRTGYFHAHDSTEIGGTFTARRFGDSSLIHSARVPFVIELVDSATGSAVRTLDTFCLSDTTHDYYAPIDTVLDLMSGTYYLRMRLVPQNLPALPAMRNSRFPVAEITGYLGDSLIGKLRHIDAVTGGTGRLSVHPNPTSGRAEILFSVPEQGQAAVTIYDAFGRRIVQPLEGTMDVGRYAIDLNGGTLPPGTYMVEFRYGANRLVEKLVVVR